MNDWHEDLGDSRHMQVDDLFDPLCVERSAPMDDQEAAMVEALCRAATPGPLVVDDQVEGEGAVMVSLPDGRMIVSLTASVEHTEDEGAIHANAQLICKARHYLLRLLRDRQQWKEQREFLHNRIRTLEVSLGIERNGKDEKDLAAAGPVVRLPK